MISDFDRSLGSRYFLNVANERTCFASCASAFKSSNVKISLHLKKAGLASRNIVHKSKKIILRCVLRFLLLYYLFLWYELIYSLHPVWPYAHAGAPAKHPGSPGNPWVAKMFSESSRVWALV